MEISRGGVGEMKGRLLMVEDEGGMRKLVGELLGREGYEREVGVDGEEGMVYLEEGGYDLVLMDVKMRGGRGMEVLGDEDGMG